MQVLSVLLSIISLNAFTVASSMKILDRDFKYGPYNKWDASMTYIWRLIPQVYIPVDYFDQNRAIKEGGPRPLYQHPVYSWVDYDWELDFPEEDDGSENLDSQAICEK